MRRRHQDVTSIAAETRLSDARALAERRPPRSPQSSGNADASGAVPGEAEAAVGSGAVGEGRGEAADKGARLCQKSGRPTIEPETGGRHGSTRPPQPVPKTLKNEG